MPSSKYKRQYDKKEFFSKLETRLRLAVREIVNNFATHIEDHNDFKDACMYSGKRCELANGFIASMEEDFDDYLADEHLEILDYRVKPIVLCFKDYMRLHISSVYMNPVAQEHMIRTFCNWMVDEIIAFHRYYLREQPLSSTPLKHLEEVTLLFESINYKMYPLSRGFRDIIEKELR